jgi:hypothetical protein
MIKYLRKNIKDIKSESNGKDNKRHGANRQAGNDIFLHKCQENDQDKQNEFVPDIFLMFHHISGILPKVDETRKAPHFNHIIMVLNKGFKL